jgi:DNA-binding FrmR family transcriptional regulator
MQLSSTLVKTAKGLEEIDKRTHKLSGRLRAVMFMIDGQRTVGALLDQAGSMAAQLETQLKELLAQNFISEVLSPDESVVVETVAKPVTQIVPTSARTTPSVRRRASPQLKSA